MKRSDSGFWGDQTTRIDLSFSCIILCFMLTDEPETPGRNRTVPCFVYHSSLDAINGEI